MEGVETDRADTPTALHADVLDWIAEMAGGPVVEAQLISTGGRLGYRVDVEKDGRRLPLFLQRGREVGAGSFNEISREAEVFRALASVGVAVPQVWGVSAEKNVLLVGRLDGVVWFHEPPGRDQQVAVAQDFIRQIARWHAAPPAELDLPSFKPVRSAREHQGEQLAALRKLFDAEDADAPIDEIARVTLSFLEQNIPAYGGRAVLCQGDTGPGNFIYKDDKVLGVIDWELAHLGDPMDDIAWLSWRATQHGFPDFPARMREYEQLSGIEVASERVYYYRVNACARLGPDFGLADMGRVTAASRRSGAAAAQDNDRTSDGSQMLMGMLHRRMRLQALGTAMGLELPSRSPVAAAAPREHARLYDNVLRQLQAMVPLIADRSAASLAKGVARQIKYLKEVDRDGHLFEKQEMADLAGLLGRTPASLREGRIELAEAARQGRFSFEAYFRYHWARMVRDDHLMREASGRLYTRTWPDLA
ncbi:MAG: putative aminoglycoside phosphotransferase [Phenylobacterium sp.]|nr:putative aminoglycoside phosphotransferase [Phenylobacterium sp.]